MLSLSLRQLPGQISHRSDLKWTWYVTKFEVTQRKTYKMCTDIYISLRILLGGQTEYSQAKQRLATWSCAIFFTPPSPLRVSRPALPVQKPSSGVSPNHQALRQPWDSRIFMDIHGYFLTWGRLRNLVELVTNPWDAFKKTRTPSDKSAHLSNCSSTLPPLEVNPNLVMCQLNTTRWRTKHNGTCAKKTP